MSIEFTKNTVGVWFVGLPDQDWLASIDLVGDEARLIYRFRYHDDDKAWESEDRKNWYQMQTERVDELVEITKVLANTLARTVGDTPYELLMADFPDLNAFMDAFSHAPFVSMRQEVLDEH